MQIIKRYISLQLGIGSAVVWEERERAGHYRRGCPSVWMARITMDKVISEQWLDGEQEDRASRGRL